MHNRAALLALALALALPLTLSSTALAVPLQLTHQGRLDDASGVPLTGTHRLTVGVYTDATSTTPLWSETLSTEFEAGVYSVVLGAGSSAPLDSALFDGSVRFLSLAVDDGAELPQRIALVSVPYAVRAGSAERADAAASVEGGVDWASITGVPAAITTDNDALAALGCSEGEVPTWQGSAWGCAEPTAGGVDTTTLIGTIDITNLPVGTGVNTVAPGDHTHGFGQITGELGLDRTTGDLGFDRVSGDLPIDRTTGDFAFARLPVGTTATTVARGDHTHTAAQIGALPVGGGTLTGALGGTTADFSSSVTVGDHNTACGSSNAGMLRFVSASKQLEVCDGLEWRILSAPYAQGQETSDPIVSCKQLKADNTASPSGLYWMKPAAYSGSPFQVWCEMEVEGGGWTLMAYNWGVPPSYLHGTYKAVSGPPAATEGRAMALDPAALSITYADVLYQNEDPAWNHSTRTYNGYWLGQGSGYNLKSNTCQVLRPTDSAQWAGQLVYFAGDGANDNGCSGGGSYFTGTHTCDDGGGGITTNNVWGANCSDSLWGCNCVIWSPPSGYGVSGIYKSTHLPSTGLNAFYVR